MSRRLLILLLVALASQCGYCQDEGQYAPEEAGAGAENALESPSDAFEEEEGSGARSYSESASDVPLIDEAEAATTVSTDDAIQCPTDLCTCSQENDGDDLNITVDCSSKDLTELPTGIDKRTKSLFLQNNKLTELPKAISEFQELEELNINDNSITEFAFGSVSELPKLRVLKAANNRLLEFPQELRNGLDLRSLQELDLGGNDMRDTLTADHFSHMENISSLTLPVSTRELIEDLCHRLGTTLQKVCTNDCNVDIEDCANYPGTPSDFIPAPNSDILDNEPDNTDLGNQSENNEGDIIVGAGEPEPSVDENILPDPVSTDNQQQQPQTNTALVGDDFGELQKNTPLVNEDLEQPQASIPLVADEKESEDEAAKAVATTTTVANSDSPSDISDGSKIAEFSLRSAVNNANDASNTPIRLSSGTAILDGPAEVGGSDVQPDSSSTNTDGNIAGVAKIQSAVVDVDPSKPTAVEAATDDEEGGKVGATSVKQGGGIDNSVIALIVAGMVIVVAGVTIKKNWSSIKNRFRSRPSPAAGATGPGSAHVNGASPEEVPLQDKSMV